MIIGALEAGGTKMVCAIGNEKGEISDSIILPTETPEKTMPKMISYYREAGIERLGIGCFGPLDLEKKTITTTPKLAWRDYPIGDVFEKSLHVPVSIDTDVNAAMLGEVKFGQAKGIKSGVYMTVGTGVGMGIFSDGKLIHGMLHPEAGHMLIARKEEDEAKSVCPYHDNCVEGLASGPAIESRYGKKAYDLPENHIAWELEADYMSQAIANLVLIVSPEIIILGGGVMKQRQLYPMIRNKVQQLLNGYVRADKLRKMDCYIVEPSLGDKQGVMGAISLAVDVQTGQ